MPHIYGNVEYAVMMYALLTRVAKCVAVDGGTFVNVLY
jgi:hypothetical protein